MQQHNNRQSPIFLSCLIITGWWLITTGWQETSCYLFRPKQIQHVKMLSAHCMLSLRKSVGAENYFDTSSRSTPEKMNKFQSDSNSDSNTDPEMASPGDSLTDRFESAGEGGSFLEETVDPVQDLAEYLWESHDECKHSELEEAVFSETEDAPDQIIGRRFSIYRCDALLGKGGMGRVYLAYHSQLGRPCALKISSPRKKDSKLSGNWYSAFREGRSAALLVHPNIVTVHAVGRHRGRQFIEMELVSGGSLKSILRKEGKLPLLKVLQWICGASKGLAFAHRHHILHRDIKPENILISPLGIPKLADFGLARHLSQPENLHQGQVVGTLPYLAPEVLQTGKHSPGSDVYSLGVTLFYLLAGRLPYQGKSVEQMAHQILTEPAPSLRSIDPAIPLEVSGLVSKMMAKAPESRPQDGTAASHLIGSVLGQFRDVESILEEALGHDPSITWMRCDEKYRLMVRLPDGRKQTVFVESSNHRADQQLLLIYSTCCPAQSSFFEQALKMNAMFSHGALTIREIDGIPHFVMINTYPRGTADAEEVRKSVLEISEFSDRIEKMLTGIDFH